METHTSRPATRMLLPVVGKEMETTIQQHHELGNSHIRNIRMLLACRICIMASKKVIPSASVPAKRLCTRPRIGTHSGRFHADDAMACWLLRQVPAFINAEIVRTRDRAVLDQLDVVVDVGGVYNHSERRFDHHQRGFDEKFDDTTFSKLSGAGLIYKHYGRDIIYSLCNENTSEEDISLLWNRLYRSFMEAIDADDNGIPQYPIKEHGEPPFQSGGTSLSARVSHLNPSWWQKEPVDEDELFEKAMHMVGEEWTEALMEMWKGWLPGRNIVKDAVKKASSVHPSGNILLLEQGCPWKSILFDLEKEMGSKFLYVVYEGSSSSDWRVQCVPVAPNSFENRKSLPETWRGLRDEQVAKISGVEDCFFVHASGFLAGVHSEEGALALASKALES